MTEKIIIIDFGSQYTQLIARRVRELNVYCEIFPFNKIPAIDSSVRGVILSGSPYSVRDEAAPKPDLSSFKGRLPLLGVCYGAQLLDSEFGGEVRQAPSREYGRAMLSVATLPTACRVVAVAHAGLDVARRYNYRHTCQYHIVATPKPFLWQPTASEGNPRGHSVPPRGLHSTHGMELLGNFVMGICGAAAIGAPIVHQEHGSEVTQKLGDGPCEPAFGVGRFVGAAVLLSKAVGKNLHCIFVDTVLMRRNEYENIMESYQNMGLNVVGVRAGSKFLDDLKGVTDPERKRKIIGRDFIEVFNAEAQKIEGARWLAQGTIYPDVIESMSVNGPSATIKSHHNVGGLPEKMNLRIVEPLRLLFKDEVRRVGRELAIDPLILERHPFPGPGLGIRIIGEVTPEKVDILQQADKIFIDALHREGLYNEVWQAGVMLLPVQSVGVMGDERTYESCVALRAVISTDGMTADWVHLPYEFLANVSNEIINRFK